MTKDEKSIIIKLMNNDININKINDACGKLVIYVRNYNDYSCFEAKGLFLNL